MKLQTNDKEIIKRFYQRRLKKYGVLDARSVDWDSNKNQKIRFEILSRVGDLNNKKVLDYGCGLADFYGYLKKHFKGIKYSGVDLVPEFVEKSKKKYPQANFFLGDLDLIKESFDYVFASGSLTFGVPDREKFHFARIDKMLKLAKKGVAFNVLDFDYYGYYDLYVTYTPEQIIKRFKKKVKDITIVRGYMDGDITVFLQK